MKVLTKDHKYELENFENKSAQGQIIQFIEKSPNNTAGELRTVNDGTTNEEVLEVLIDRMKGLGSKFPSRENSLAITHLQEALFWLNERTRERIGRGVEGKHLA